jgi:hypothetical protein
MYVLIFHSYGGYIAVDYPYEANPPATIGWAETATDMGFVAPAAYTSGDIVCHRGATNAKLTATIPAGGSVTMFWSTWDGSHHGPIVDYIASCKGDCSTVDKSTLEFVKIAEAGLRSDATWATDRMMSNNNSWTITIPSTLAPGNYVLRHELIALHSADTLGGAQNFPQCINLQVTGSGTDSPSGTLATSLYTPNDAGIYFNIYLPNPSLQYPIPGPALWTSGSSGTVKPAVADVQPATTTAVASSPSAVDNGMAASLYSVPTTFVTSVKATATGAGGAVQTDAASTGTWHKGDGHRGKWSSSEGDDETEDNEDDGDEEDEACDE